MPIYIHHPGMTHTWKREEKRKLKSADSWAQDNALSHNEKLLLLGVCREYSNRKPLPRSKLLVLFNKGLST